MINYIKKLIICFLCLAVLLSTFAPVVTFAENNNTIMLDTQVDVSAASGERTTLYFTPEENGVYLYYTTGTYYTIYGNISSVDDSDFVNDISDSGYCGFSIYCYMRAGKTYALESYQYNDGTFNYTVGITLSDIASVEISDVTIDGCSSSLQYSYNDKTGKNDLEWWQYVYSPTFTVILNDGTKLQGSNGIQYKGKYYHFKSSDNQSYQNQWNVGTYTVTGSIFGISDTFNVTVLENPVDRIEIENIVLYDELDSHIETSYDGETGEYIDWQCYSYTPKYTVYFKDGTSRRSDEETIWNNNIYYNGREYSISKKDNQSYQNQWCVGTYTVKGAIMGVSDTFSVTIKEKPVIDRVVIDDVILVENIDSKEITSWDTETGKNDLVWYRYDYSHPNLTVYFKDGTTIYGDNGEVSLNGKNYSLSYSDGQSYKNQWTVGKNTVNAQIMGFETSFNVIIKKNPIKSIDIISIEQISETEYLYVDVSGNRVYNIPTFTYKLTYLNGSFEKFTHYGGFYTDNEHISITSNQQESPWCVGGKNIVTVSCGNVSTSFNVYLTEKADWEYIEQNGGLFIINCSLSDEEITVPTEINGKIVIGIMDMGDSNRNITKVNIPSSVSYISKEAFYNSCVKTVDLGESAAQVCNDYFGWSLNEFIVAETNSVYSVNDGILYNKTGDTLVVYPNSKGSVYTIPDNVVNINCLWNGLGYYSLGTHIYFKFSDNCKAVKKIDGITYTSDMKTVVDCDLDKTGDYIMPDSVTTVAAEAFFCSQLSAIAFSNSVTELVYFSVGECDKLETVKLPQNLTTIGFNAFSGSNLKNLNTLPDSLTTIGESAFTSTNLQSITIPANVTKWGNYAFASSNLTNVALSEGLAEIGPYAFQYTQISQIDFPSSMSSIAAGAFSYTQIENLNLPENIVQIGDYAFSNTKIKILDIPNTVKNIGSGAFSYTLIEKLRLPDNLTEISSYAFAGTLLNEILIPNSIVTIGDGAFTNTSIKSLTIPQNVTTIGSHAFSSTKLKELNIPDNVKYIGNYAFAYTNIDRLSFGAGITQISEGVFSDTNLTTVNIPQNISIIGDFAFSDSPVSKVEFKADKVSIGNSAFRNCPLKDTVLTDNIISIGEYAFYGNSMTSVKIPDSVTDITYYSFAYSKELSDIDIPDNIDFIDGTAFDGTAWYINQSDGVVYLENALYGYKGYMPKDTRIDVKEGVTAIADYAFEARDNLKSVKLPKETKTIGDFAFYNCRELTTVEIQKGLTYIGEGAFCGCYELTNVFIPATVKQIFDSSFKDCYNLTIVGYKGSAAEKYAIERGIPFTVLKTGGDVTNDNDINNKDLGILMQYLNGWDVNINLDAADVNADDDVNNKDYGLLMQFINGWDVILY